MDLMEILNVQIILFAVECTNLVQKVAHPKVSVLKEFANVKL
jgi:hypothetical protein